MPPGLTYCSEGGPESPGGTVGWVSAYKAFLQLLQLYPETRQQSRGREVQHGAPSQRCHHYAWGHMGTRFTGVTL